MSGKEKTQKGKLSKLKKALVVVGLLFLSFNLVSCGQEKYFSYQEAEDGTAIITGYKGGPKTIGKNKELSIPKKIKGKIVTTINTEVVLPPNVETLIVPDTVTKIEKCPRGQGLKAIKLSNNLRSIGEKSFSIQNFETIALPDSLETIGNGAFQECKNLKSITIPSNVKTIGEYAFYKSGLETIVISDGVKEIGNSAFSCCASLKEVSVSGSVERIQPNVFMNCQALETITLKEGIIEIGDSMFSECKLIKNITLPNSITRIGKYSFSDCNSLESIKIPGSVKEIDEGAFASCQNLKDVNLDDTDHISLGIRSFTECTSLEEITFPCYYELYQSTFYKSGLKTVYRNTPKGIKLKFVKSRDMSDDGNVIYLTNYNKNIKDF